MSARIPRLFKMTRKWAAGSGTVAAWRRSRYDLFMELCSVQPDEQILDVGAGRGGALERFNTVNRIVAVDPQPGTDGWLGQPNVEIRVGDGTNLPFAAGEFPVVFSSSVIEHVPAKLQHAFAEEIRRVGARYFVQTPNRYFPIEPHYQLPFFQFLPESTRRWLNRRFTLGWREKGNWQEANLLSARQLRELFPDAEIHREKLFGLTKSLMAVRR